MQRRYTLAEIDEMRALVADRMEARGAHDGDNQARRVEDVLRTLMANGTDPQELRD